MVNQEKETYSFSKLSMFNTCKYGYYLTYVEKRPGLNNAFASYGTLCHEILEQYAKGTYKLEDLASIFEWSFDVSVQEQFPPNKYADLRSSYYEDGLEFFKKFKGYDDCEILGVEEEFNINIRDWILHGFIDLVYRDKDGKLIIRDYKSKSSFKSIIERDEYARQLYLYSLYVKDKYGEFPAELEFLMLRKNQTVKIVFDRFKLLETLDWANNTVDSIRDALDYPANLDYYFCNHICDYRNACELKE